MLVPSAIVLDESIYTAVPTLLACGRKSSGKATVLIAFPVGTAALCQKVIITTLLIRTDWPLVMPYADRSSSPQAILVLNTLRKMYKTEFCLNNYTNGRNTNKAANSDFTVGANYIIFKGFKICWGYNSIDLPGKTTTAYARQWNAFPITFSQARVFLTKAESTYDGNVTGMTVGNSFTNGFNIQARCTRDAGTNPTYSYSWLAVGK